MKKIIKANSNLEIGSDVFHMCEYMGNILDDIQTNGIDDLSSIHQSKVYKALREMYNASSKIEDVLSNYSM